VKPILLAGLALLGAARGSAQQDERWQVTLNDGRIIWELRLVQLKGDTLVVRHGDSTYSVAVGQVDELRLAQKSERRQTAEPNRYGGVLGGADDEIHRLTLYTLNERRQIIEQVFKDHAPQTSPPPSP